MDIGEIVGITWTERMAVAELANHELECGAIYFKLWTFRRIHRLFTKRAVRREIVRKKVIF